MNTLDKRNTTMEKKNDNMKKFTFWFTIYFKSMENMNGVFIDYVVGSDNMYTINASNIQNKLSTGH